MIVRKILLFAAIAMLACTSARAQLQNPEKILVLDAHGQQVGTFVEMFKGDASTVGVALSVNGTVFETWVGSGGFMALSGGYDALDFESTDCSGQAFTFAHSNGPPVDGAANAALIAPGNTVYLPTGPPRTIDVKSSLDSTGTCQGSTVPQAFDVPVQATVNLNDFFTPPFRVTSSGSTLKPACCGDCNGDGQVTVDEILTSVNYALNGCPAQ